MLDLKETVHDLVAKVPFDKLPLDKLNLDKLSLDKIDPSKALAKIDPKKVAPFALMLARRSWPLAIALGVGAAAYGAYRYSQTHRTAAA